MVNLEFTYSRKYFQKYFENSNLKVICKRGKMVFSKNDRVRKSFVGVQEETAKQISWKKEKKHNTNGTDYWQKKAFSFWFSVLVMVDSNFRRWKGAKSNVGRNVDTRIQILDQRLHFVSLNICNFRSGTRTGIDSRRLSGFSIWIFYEAWSFSVFICNSWIYSKSLNWVWRMLSAFTAVELQSCSLLKSEKKIFNQIKRFLNSSADLYSATHCTDIWFS